MYECFVVLCFFTNDYFLQNKKVSAVINASRQEIVEKRYKYNQGALMSKQFKQKKLQLIWFM